MRALFLLGLCFYAIAGEACRFDRLLREGRTAPVEVLFLLNEGRKEDAAALFPRLDNWIMKRAVLRGFDSKDTLADEVRIYRTVMRDPSPQVDCALLEALGNAVYSEKRQRALKNLLAEREADGLGIFKAYPSDRSVAEDRRTNPEGMDTLLYHASWRGRDFAVVKREFERLGWAQRRAVMRASIEDRYFYRVGEMIETIKDHPSSEVDRMIATALSSVMAPDERERFEELNAHRRSQGRGVRLQEFKYYLRTTGQRAEYD